ncbi:hypothetical protein QYE76_059298 [Lolium multiflorum]|uniref:Retroviral polymerase SH3-like domain-containing protein n=1 Tax=Lolium multiflorum TaxID=4521 RepID=A0AAD8QHW4_LOLMU|nr:hypothetical protein QYE76_059298 [Lolium multiflorum]
MLRTLNDCVCTLLFHASMPPRFWPDALATATLLVNIRPCRVRWSYTPHHLLYGAPPAYDDLRIFGCRCYPNTAATAAHKLAPRSLPCVFLGYPANTKGYRWTLGDTSDDAPGARWPSCGRAPTAPSAPAHFGPSSVSSRRRIPAAQTLPIVSNNTEEEMERGHEAATPQGGAARRGGAPAYGVGPLGAPRLCPFARLIPLLQRENPSTESHDTRKVTETPPPSIPSRGILEIASGTLPERGIITGGLYITMPASGLMRERSYPDYGSTVARWLSSPLVLSCLIL